MTPVLSALPTKIGKGVLYQHFGPNSSHRDVNYHVGHWVAIHVAEEQGLSRRKDYAFSTNAAGFCRAHGERERLAPR